MNKAASLAVKSLLGVGSVAGAASGGIVLWNQKFSGKNVEISESHENKEVREEDKEKQKAPEGVENLDNPNNKEEKADERGSHKTQDELQITGNSKERKEDDDKGSLKQQNDAEDHNSPEAKARKEEEAKKMEDRSVKWKDKKASLESEEKSWLSGGCNMERKESYTECDLTSGDLKKIKFKDLGEGKEEVTVSPNDSVNIKLKIFLLGDLKKKFLFTNSSSTSIVVSKGGKKVTLKGNSSTEFLREEEGLVMVKLENYGIPETCMKSNALFTDVKPEYSRKQNIKQCVLSAGDLSKIKFHGFSGEGNSVVTPLWGSNGKHNWNHDHAIILTIGEGKYSIYNYFSDLPWYGQLGHRPIKITRGGFSVVLEGNMESEFTVEGDSLKKEEVTELGFPKRCEMGSEDDIKTCELSDNDIRRLKLKETGVSPDIKYEPTTGDQEMNLRIEKADDGDFPGGKKYFLSPKGDYSITISNTAEVKDGVGKEGESGTKTLQFDKGVEKTFKNENNELVLVN